MKLLIVLAALALAACATSERPVAQLGAAHSALDQAETLASQYAPAELAAARQKLARAEAAYRNDDWTSARRLAEEAQVDATYAQSVAENERSRRASAELAQSIDQLKRELGGQAQ